MRAKLLTALMGSLLAVCALGAPRAEEPAAAPPPSPLTAIREDLLALRFESALAAIETLLRDPALPEEARLDALVLRSQAHAATGALDAAEQDYRQILDLDPAFEPDPGVAPRKAIARFEKARSARVGMLRLDVDPPDAKVFVDGRPARTLASGLLPAIAGSRVLRLERKGFDLLERKIDVEAGRETPFVIRLVPNSRSVLIRTDPDGVRVTVDGRPAGETAKPRSAALDAPAELLVEDLPPGEHSIVLSKPCFRTLRQAPMITVDLMDHSPLPIGPAILDPVRSRLTLKGTIPGAEVRVDGAPVGSLPLAPLDLCPGEREVEARVATRVVWWGRVELPEDGGLDLDLRPRPNLVRLAADWPSTLVPFAEAFSSPPPRPIQQGADLGAAKGWEAAGLPAGTDLALAVIPAVEGGPPERRLLFSPLLKTVEALSGAPPDPSRPEWLKSAAGIRLADSRSLGKAIVVEVLPGSPAAAAGIAAGARILTVGGLQVGSSRQAIEELRSAPPGSEIELGVSGSDGVAKTVRVRLAATPVVPVHLDAGASPAVAAAWAAAEGAVPGAAAAPSALANLALLLSRAGRHDLAADTLRRIVWGERNGIGAGTVAYLLGRELAAQGLEAEARAAFLRARDSAATAQDDEGLEVAPAAADHLRDLGVGPESAAAPATGR